MRQYLFKQALRRFFAWARQSVGYLWLVVLAGYLAVSASQSMYRSYQSKKDTQVLRDKLNQALLEKQRLEALIVYYQTDSFKEKELRRTLLLKMPNEKVYALPEASQSEPLLEDSAISGGSQPATNVVDQLPYWKQWINYIIQ